MPNDLIRGDVFFWRSLMAAALIPAIPLALLYNAFLDRFIKVYRRRVPVEIDAPKVILVADAADGRAGASSARPGETCSKRGTAAAFAVGMFGGLTDSALGVYGPLRYAGSLG